MNRRAGVPRVRRERAAEFTALLREAGWDLLLFYGSGWRDDYFRSLIDLSSAAPHALAGLRPSGEVFALLTDPWDAERIGGLGDECPVTLDFDPVSALASLPGISDGSVVAVAGLELMEACLAQALARATGREPQSATARVDRLRMIKRPEEIEAIERAAALADEAYRHFVETIEPGMAEFELVAEVEAFLKARGAEDNFMLISSGGVEVKGMKPPIDRRFQPGDVVATELTPRIDGCYAQLCRTLVLGEPTPAQTEGFAIFARAQEAARRRLRPGLTVAEIARVQNDVFREAGFGEYTGRQYTRVRGHAVGLFVDEPPAILEEVDCVVEEGMVLIPHPNTYLPTTGYMVFGDTLRVTAGGCETLASTERKLFVKPV